jgi:membrane protein
MPYERFSRLFKIITAQSGSEEESASLGSNLTRLERFAHFWVLVWNSFVRNRCPVRASALSYTTLLALIPTLAVAMSITSVLLKDEGREQIQTFLRNFVDKMIPMSLTHTNIPRIMISETDWDPMDWDFYLPGTNEVASVTDANASAPITDARVDVAQEKVADIIYGFIQNTYSGTLGATGVAFLLWTAILMLSRIEDTFNDIWGVTRGRTWSSRVWLYWGAITLVPLLLIAALGLAQGSSAQRMRDVMAHVPFLTTLTSTILPVVVISFTFAILYKVVPNTKVNFSAALVGGALAGTSWHLFNVLSVSIARSAVNESRIYGSLVVLPLMMIGLYIVWLMVLFGAQVAYAFQNRESYLQERLAEHVNQRGREFVALRLMTSISQRYLRGLPPATITQISSELGVPSRLAQQVLQTLLAARLVVEVSRGDHAFVPARPLEQINAHHVLMAMRATIGQELVTRDEPVREEVLGEFARIQEAEKQAASIVTMLDLVHRAEQRLELAPPPPKETGKTEKFIPLPPAPVPTPAKEHEEIAKKSPDEPTPTEVAESHEVKSVAASETKPVETTEAPKETQQPQEKKPTVAYHQDYDERESFPL